MVKKLYILLISIFLLATTTVFSQNIDDDAEELDELEGGPAQTSLGLQLEYGLSVFNSQTTLQLPFVQYPTDNRIAIGANATLALNHDIELFFAPMYNYTAMNSLIFIKPTIQIHSLFATTGVTFWFSKTTGLSLGFITNYEVSARLFTTRSVAGSNSRVPLVSQDRAIPGFGSFIGLNFLSNNGKINFTLGIEAFKVALERYFIGGKFGVQFRFLRS